MKTVNPHLMGCIFNPFAGLADDDDAVEKYRDLNPNDQNAVREVIRELSVPYVQNLRERVKIRVKLSCQYFLSTEQPDRLFRGLFEGSLPPFDAPDDARSIFIWAWNECFPGESYVLANPKDYTEVFDVDETWRVFIE